MSARIESSESPGLSGVVPFRFACQRCGHCCSGAEGYVWLEDGESERLAAALELAPEVFERRHVRAVVDPERGELRRALTEDALGGGRCSLLVGRNTCRAYAARPEQCRSFPYWRAVLQDRAAFEAARATCPGIAVVVEPELAARADRELAALYAELGPRPQRASCCLDAPGGSAVFATALEADHAARARAARAADAAAGPGCRLGEAAPLTCRLAADADGPAWHARLRALERALGYPAAYAPLGELLAARGVDVHGERA